MQSHGGATDHPLKSKKPKSREVSSRFLLPNSTTSSSGEYGNQSPNSILSLLMQKPKSSTSSRKHKSLESSGFLRGLWPSSSVHSNPKPDTLADCIGNDRIREFEERKSREKPSRNPLLINRQRSCTEFSRFAKEKKKSISSKENHNPIFGGSMRYTGKSRFPWNSSKSNSNPPDEKIDMILPGQISLDEVSLRKKPSISDGEELESEYSDLYSDGTSIETPIAGKSYAASNMAPTVSSRKHGIDVPSKFMYDLSSRSRRWSADSGKSNSASSNANSPKNFALKSAIKGNWARSGSLKASASENRGKLTISKPPSSPSKGKGVGNIFNLGFEYFKGRKSCSSPLGLGSSENVHQLRLLHNRLMQWRYSRARADRVNGNIVKQVESNFVSVWNEVMKLQHSVIQKKIQLQKENLNLKLNYILHSLIKLLETWGNMEREHSSTVTNTTDYLHSAICRVPLVDGAKVELQPASITVRSDLAASIKLTLTNFSSTIEETEGVLAALAEVVVQEKQLLEECMELFRHISALEVQERSLKSSIMQLRLLQQQQLQILA